MSKLDDPVVALATHRGVSGDIAALDALIAALGSDEDGVRREARWYLVAIGHPAVLSLAAALADPRARVRLEAARTLGAIRDPKCAPALVRALVDDNFDVRWFAAEALVAVGPCGLKPLLQALVAHPPSLDLIDGTHHALYVLDKKGSLPETVRPVLEALEGPEPYANVPPAAEWALAALAEEEGSCGGSDGLPVDLRADGTGPAVHIACLEEMAV